MNNYVIFDIFKTKTQKTRTMIKTTTFFTTLFLLFIVGSLNAQVAWESTYNMSNFIGANNTERAHTGVQATDGGYFIAGENYTTGAARYAYLLKLAPNGDSLWSRIYPQPLTGIFKLYYHNNNLWGVFTTNGSSRLRFAQINEANGDTSNTFFAPHGNSSTYTYYDHEVLPNGDYLLLYTSGSAATFCRFTPGDITPTWQHDFAGQVFKALIC